MKRTFCFFLSSRMISMREVLTVGSYIINKCLLVWFEVSKWVTVLSATRDIFGYRLVSNGRDTPFQGHTSPSKLLYDACRSHRAVSHTLGNSNNVGACDWAAGLSSVVYIGLSICHANKIAWGSFIPKSIQHKNLDVRQRCNIMSKHVYTLRCGLARKYRSTQTFSG